MESGFKDPIKPRKEVPPCKPKDGKNSPWDFRAPEYDQRHSQFVNAGTNYGTGFNQPVGTRNPSNKEAVPYGKVDTMDLYPESFKP